MILEEAIFAHLSTSTAVTGHTGARIYPVVLPQDPTLPALTFTRVATMPENTLSGYANYENALVEIDCWSSALKSSKLLADQVRKVMDGATGYDALLTGETVIYEPEVDIYRITQDYSCWIATS